MKERVVAMEKNLGRRMDRLQGTVTFMSKCVEDFNENFSSIMDAIRDQRVRNVCNDFTNEVVFPFTSTVLVDSYVEEDPKMVKLIDRYVRTSFSNPQKPHPPLAQLILLCFQPFIYNT